MEPKERIKLELQSHRKAIDEIQKNINLYRKDIKELIGRIETGDIDFYKKESKIWEIVHAKVDSICKMQKNLEETQELILLKAPLIL